LIFAL